MNDGERRFWRQFLRNLLWAALGALIVILILLLFNAISPYR